MIDLKELNRVIEKIDEGGLILGGRFAKINEIVEYFFDEIKKCNANLVFFARLDEGKYKNIDIFSSTFPAYVCISQRKCLKTYLRSNHGSKQKYASNLYPSERVWFNLQQICTKYGQFYVNYGLSKRAILAYTREKREDVMAVMTRNTEFFVHNCNFEYWSLSDIDFSALKIAKFCRERLGHTLDFSPHQMQLLLVLSELEPADKFKLFASSRFLDLLSYVERQRHGPDGYDLSKFKDKLTKNQIEEMEKQISDLEELNRFRGDFNEDINDEFITELMDNDIIFDMVLLFCKQNIPFAYKLINEKMSVPKDLLFIDLRQAGSVQYIDLVIQVTLKMVGITFKDISSEKRPKIRAVKIDRDSSVPSGSSVQQEMDIIYPTSMWIRKSVSKFQNPIVKYFDTISSNVHLQ